jgi:hypothetical protein
MLLLCYTMGHAVSEREAVANVSHRISLSAYLIDVIVISGFEPKASSIWETP